MGLVLAAALAGCGSVVVGPTAYQKSISKWIKNYERPDQQVLSQDIANMVALTPATPTNLLSYLDASKVGDDDVTRFINQPLPPSGGPVGTTWEALLRTERLLFLNSVGTALGTGSVKRESVLMQLNYIKRWGVLGARLDRELTALGFKRVAALVH
jgi:hypothetical protein